MKPAGDSKDKLKRKADIARRDLTVAEHRLAATAPRSVPDALCVVQMVTKLLGEGLQLEDWEIVLLGAANAIIQQRGINRNIGAGASAGRSMARSAKTTNREIDRLPAG
jgi:hypothetical protein